MLSVGGGADQLVHTETRACTPGRRAVVWREAWLQKKERKKERKIRKKER